MRRRNGIHRLLLLFAALALLALFCGCENPLGGGATDSGPGGPVAAPVFSPAAGIYREHQAVTISTPTPGAVIKYTTDGSTPSLTVGVVYEHAIWVPVTTTIRAAAFRDGIEPSGTAEALYTIDFFPAGTSLSPDPGSIISSTSQITVNFDEEMDPATLSIGGELAVDFGSAVWDSITFPNDTVRLEPAIGEGWTIGSFRTLTVDCFDRAGNPIIQVSADYDVCVIYVRASDGDDGSDGSRDAPLRSVAAGIFRADTLFSNAEVKVAQGSYDINSALGETIVLRQGISVFGGYSPDDWSIRSPSSYVSSITDTNSTADGTASNPLAAVSGGTGLTRDTVFSGFKVKTANRPNVAGIVNHGSSPSYIGNYVEIGGEDESYGFHNVSASPMIRGNRVIVSGSGFSRRCIYERGCTSEIVNNEIMLGISSNISFYYAVYQVDNSHSVIRNNTINLGFDLMGSGGGVNLQGGSSPVIENNNFSTWHGAYAAIVEEDELSTPQSVRNNNFHNCIFYRDSSWNNYSTISAMETYLAGLPVSTGGNISVEPIFVNGPGPDNNWFTHEDNDWRLDNSSHKNLRQGGIDGGLSGEDWEFDDDIEGISRSADTSLSPDNANAGGWSMGCHEWF